MKVRNLDLDFKSLDETEIPRHWFNNNCAATHITNGVNLLFPAGERYFIRSVNRYLPRIKDPVLRDQIKMFFGQEGQHARSHESFFETLRAQGYDIDTFLKRYEKVMYQWIEKALPGRLNLAVTAASEHFTAILAENLLSDQYVYTAHPALQKLLMWHAAEEIEHKSVAFDVLEKTSLNAVTSYLVRITGLFLATLFLSVNWAVATTSLLWQDRKRVSFRQFLKGLKDANEQDPIVQRVFIKGILQYLKPGFHPSQNKNEHLSREYLQRAQLA